MTCLWWSCHVWLSRVSCVLYLRRGGVLATSSGVPGDLGQVLELSTVKPWVLRFLIFRVPEFSHVALHIFAYLYHFFIAATAFLSGLLFWVHVWHTFETSPCRLQIWCAKPWSTQPSQDSVVSAESLESILIISNMYSTDFDSNILCDSKSNHILYASKSMLIFYVFLNLFPYSVFINRLL